MAKTTIQFTPQDLRQFLLQTAIEAAEYMKMNSGPDDKRTSALGTEKSISDEQEKAVEAIVDEAIAVELGLLNSDTQTYVGPRHFKLRQQN